jgi:hydroxyacid-oxoacid transhydrogenase
MSPTPSRAAILRLINASQHTNCPCHGSKSYLTPNQLRRLAIPVERVDKEYAFEVAYFFSPYVAVVVNPIQVAASNLRFGDGVTREVGMDLKNMKATKVSTVFV